MVTCSFCGDTIVPGTGKIYIKKDGKRLDFCSSKCEKNMINLGRTPRETRWTAEFKKEKNVLVAKPAAPAAVN